MNTQKEGSAVSEKLGMSVKEKFNHCLTFLLFQSQLNPFFCVNLLAYLKTEMMTSKFPKIAERMILPSTTILSTRMRMSNQSIGGRGTPPSSPVPKPEVRAVAIVLERPFPIPLPYSSIIVEKEEESSEA